MDRSLLVLDKDQAFLETLLSEQKEHYPICPAFMGAAAQKLIADPKAQLAAIFVNPNVNLAPNWLSVVRCAYQNRPATPIYLILNDANQLKELGSINLRALGIKKTIQKPFGYRQLLELVAPIALSFDAKVALEKARISREKLAGEIPMDGEYLAIRAEDFLSGSVSYFDVYIRMAGGRFIKLLQAGDSFSPDRIEQYLKHGVTHFHIRKEVQEVYLGYCDHVASALLKHDIVPAEIKGKQIMNAGEETLNLLRERGISSENIRYAEKFAKNVRMLALQLPQKNGDLMSRFLANIAAYDHGVGVTMLAGILARTLQLETERAAQIIGLAGLLHDLSLADMPESFLDENEGLMTPEERIYYRAHPQISAEALAKINGINPAVVQAVEQHHMRIENRGFPKRTGTTLVTRLAEVIGICDEYQRLLIKHKDEPTPGLLHATKEEILPGFGTTVAQAFLATFFQGAD